jgi:hypothetical protein
VKKLDIENTVTNTSKELRYGEQHCRCNNKIDIENTVGSASQTNVTLGQYYVLVNILFASIICWFTLYSAREFNSQKYFVNLYTACLQLSYMFEFVLMLLESYCIIEFVLMLLESCRMSEFELMLLESYRMSEFEVDLSFVPY